MREGRKDPRARSSAQLSPATPSLSTVWRRRCACTVHLVPHYPLPHPQLIISYIIGDQRQLTGNKSTLHSSPGQVKKPSCGLGFKGGSIFHFHLVLHSFSDSVTRGQSLSPHFFLHHFPSHPFRLAPLTISGHIPV